MPANPDCCKIGVRSVDFALAESVDITAQAEAKVLADKDGKFAQAATIKRKVSFSIKGKGDIPGTINLGEGESPVAGITAGKTIITSVEESQKADDWNEWSVEGTNYPSAQ